MLTRSSIQKKPFSNRTSKTSHQSASSIYPYMFDSSLTYLDFGPKMKGKANEKAVVVCSTPVNLIKKHKEKEVVAHISFCAVKKAKGSICQPLLRTWNEVEEAEHELLAYPLPNDKVRKGSPKGRFKKCVPLQDFIDQQNAYFKEIDEYELDVEEVE